MTIRTAGKPSYYVQKYYTEGGLRPGHWRGKGANALGLDGEVTLADLEQIAKGSDPRTGEQLIQIQKQRRCDPADETRKQRVDHRWGWDVVPLFAKPLDVITAVADRELRDYLLSVHHRAVDWVTDYFESDLKLAQRGKGGRQKEHGGLVLAQFTHLENRLGEPLVHTHVLVANMALRADGSWCKLDSTALYQSIRSLGPLYRATVAKIIRNELGLDLTPALDESGDEKGWFAVEGVPRDLVAKWSSRRAEIIRHLEGKGLPIGDSSIKAKDRAARTTRQAKGPPQTIDEMQERWRKEASGFSFTAAAARSLLGKARPIDDPHAFERAWNESLRDLMKCDACFSERLLVQRVAEKLQIGQFSGDEIVRRVRGRLDRSPAIVRLQDELRDRQFTTREMWECEQKVLGYNETLRKRSGAQASERILKRIFVRNRKLDAEGQNAVRTAVLSNSAIRVVTGVAGAGKTTCVKEIAKAFRNAGFNPIGAGLTGISKEELSNRADIPSRTVESYLRSLDRPFKERFGYRFKHEVKQLWRAAQGKRTWRITRPHFTSKTVLILDEASLVDTRSMEVLLRHAVRAKATVVLIGDPAQLPPIFAGMPLKRIIATAPHAHLATNRRQLDPADREAVQWLRDGEVAKAFKSYVDRSRVTLGKDKHDTISKLVDAWEKAGGYRLPKDFEIYVQTKEEARAVNRMCQERRLAAVRTPHLLSVSNGRERFYRGDRVIFNAPARKYGGIENGFKGTVTSVDPIRKELRVKLDRDPRSVFERFSPNPVITIPLRTFGDKLSLGMALTTHRSQSRTVSHAFVLMGGQLLDRAMAYVQLTRARKTTRIFVDRSHAGGDDFRDLVAAVERSRPKWLAHDKGRYRGRSRAEEREQHR